jgi:hypothetical protein
LVGWKELVGKTVEVRVSGVSQVIVGKVVEISEDGLLHLISEYKGERSEKLIPIKNIGVMELVPERV